MVIYFVLLADSFTFSKSYFSQTTTNQCPHVSNCPLLRLWNWFGTHFQFLIFCLVIFVNLWMCDLNKISDRQKKSLSTGVLPSLLVLMVECRIPRVFVCRYIVAFPNSRSGESPMICFWHEKASFKAFGLELDGIFRKWLEIIRKATKTRPVNWFPYRFEFDYKTESEILVIFSPNSVFTQSCREVFVSSLIN